MLNTEKIKEFIKIARESVNDEEEPYKTEAFKIIFSNLISSNIEKPFTTTSKKDSKHKTNPVIQKIATIEIKNDFDDLTKKCKITVDELKETINIKNNLIEITKRLTGSEKLKHNVYSLCILASYRILAEVESLPSSYLIKCLDLSGAGDLIHLGRNLADTALIVTSGKNRGTEYRITGKGLDVAYDLIHKFAKGEKIDES